jgi:hypothetical protein
MGAAIAGVGDPGDVTVDLQVSDELGHGPFGHLGPLGQQADGCPGVVEVLEDSRFWLVLTPGGTDGAVLPCRVRDGR